MVAGMKSASLLVVASTVSASVIDLPIVVQNSYASVEFQVGTPPKAHRLHFDTGSSTAWMVSTECTAISCPNPSNSGYVHRQYNISASSSAIDLDSYSRITYIDGDSVAGQAVEDVFATLDGTLEWNQTFLAANQSDWRFITADGFLGLGFSSIAENSTAPLVETLLWEGKLDAPRFAVFYGKNRADNGTQDGVLTIGGSHEEKYVDGEVVYTPLRKEDPYQLWRAPLRSVNVLVANSPSNPNSTVTIHNGKLPTTITPEGQFPDANVTWPMYGFGAAVFDTGAGRVSVPEDIAAAMYFNLGWNLTKLLEGDEHMGCEHSNASWAVTFTLGEGEGESENDVSFSLRGDEFLAPGTQCMPPFDTSGTESFALIGKQFLQRYYSVFDFGASKAADYEPRIGFGRLKKEYDYLYV